MTPRELARKMAFISPTLDDSGFRRVDVVIEAVVERLDVKQKVLAQLEPRLDERAVFATNTSSLPIGEIAARALHPERVVGMHFFNPVDRMPLVEVIAGRRSSPEAVATVHALARRMGKVPVIVQDGPGFLVNRILTFYLFEAMLLLREGIRIEEADRAMVAFGMPMGPFALLDQVGLDTAKHVGEVLRAAFPQRVGAEESVVDLLVERERLGKKNGRGFYRYRDDKPAGVDSEIYKLVGAPAPRELPPEMLQERMVLAMLNEAALCLQDGVVREPAEVDVAMIMGTGFPPFRGGLLRHADSVGVPVVADRLARLADAHGVRYRPAELWRTMVREQRRFYP
jgi:3-hydroxyacyl-CoA dehydrogenase/enoyl-CoA hydratase/3-hydroxybutyryl-CoA epimerase